MFDVYDTICAVLQVASGVISTLQVYLLVFSFTFFMRLCVTDSSILNYLTG